MLQLIIGFGSGFVIGVAVFTHPLSRAVVFGLAAGVIIGDIVIDGIEGYLSWTAQIPAEMAKFTGFWIAMAAGVAGGARTAAVQAAKVRSNSS